jgi:hypothetical protein
MKVIDLEVKTVRVVEVYEAGDVLECTYISPDAGRTTSLVEGCSYLVTYATDNNLGMQVPSGTMTWSQAYLRGEVLSGSPSFEFKYVTSIVMNDEDKV